mmetsp:Transcript_18111/g.42303  ORF Transcript_18111/g.42303 Transcript_18111/m.42303 type:complete len:461 (-) Transcript_18111:75-1457(-)
MLFGGMHRWCSVPLLLVLLGADANRLRARKQNEQHSDNVDYRLTLTNHDNVQYTAPFSVGEQVLPVIYDTGSFEIIVLSTLCTTCTGGQEVYDSAKSASFVASELQAQHEFGSGPVVSQMGFEAVRLGGSDSPLAAPEVPFWQVMDHSIDVWNSQAHFSGIVGLGHTPEVPQGFGVEGPKEKTLLETLQISAFALCLKRGADLPPGYLTFGPSVVSAIAPGNGFHPLEVVGQVHWGIKMMNFEVPGAAVQPVCQPSCGAIVDSGTSLIAVPPSAEAPVRALASMINEDCSNVQSLPVLRFQLDNSILELPPQAYVMKVLPQQQNSSIWDRIFGAPTRSTTPVCVLAFMTIDKMSQHGPVWVLGMPFLRYYHTVFDRAGKKVHITPSNSECTLQATPATVLLNASASESGSAAVSASTSRVAQSAYRAEDYQPMEVDLNAIRLPHWEDADVEPDNPRHMAL